MCCGLVKGSELVAERVFTAEEAHTYVVQRYDYMTHLDARTKCIKNKVPYDVYLRVLRTFPYVYQSFFKVAKGRKNFMSYPYVIRKLLEVARIDASTLGLKMIKTPCKVREAERFWKGILEITPEISRIMRNA